MTREEEILNQALSIWQDTESIAQVHAKMIPVLKSYRQPVKIIDDSTITARPVEAENVLNKLASIVCEHFDVTKAQLKKKERKRSYVEARQSFCVAASEVLKVQVVKIGKYINQHHSSVIHALKKDESNMKYKSYSIPHTRVMLDAQDLYRDYNE